MTMYAEDERALFTAIAGQLEADELRRLVEWCWDELPPKSRPFLLRATHTVFADRTAAKKLTPP